MIAFVRGPVALMEENSAVIDVNGIGYRVGMTAMSLGQLMHEEGDVFVHTYTHVREDTLVLFGFMDETELAAFKILIAITGIGPKLGIQILGAITPDELGNAVAREDLPRLKALPGVGKKTAERLIVELRDKPLGTGNLEGQAVSSVKSPQMSGVIPQVKSAMENLGYKGQKLERALVILSEREEGMSLEEGIREALALLR